MSKFKMVKVECEVFGTKASEFINPRDVSCVYPICYGEEYNKWGEVHPKIARTKIRMHNGDTICSHKELDELVAEIEAAANA